MRYFLSIGLVLLSATSALAQVAPQQPIQQLPVQQVAQPQQLSDNLYAPAPVYQPAPQQVYAPSVPQHVAPAPAPEYGDSVITDIRQMNF